MCLYTTYLGITSLGFILIELGNLTSLFLHKAQGAPLLLQTFLKLSFSRDKGHTTTKYFITVKLVYQ